MTRLVRHMAGPALAAVLVALVGCSALQIDVDVYKGALLNEEEVQRRQYANMALASAPFMERIKGELEVAQRQCKDGCSEKPALDSAVRFFDRVLHFYGDDAAPKAQIQQPSKPPPGCVAESPNAPSPSMANALKFIAPAQRTEARNKGIKALTSELTDAYALPNTPAWRDCRNQAIEKASAALDELLLPFSQTILEYVNNEALFYRSGGSDHDLVRTARSSLQSLANTLLVHGNDMQRRAKRTADQVRRADDENWGIANAFRRPPPLAFDDIVDKLTKPVESKQAAAAPATAAGDPLAGKKADLGQLQQQRKQQAEELAKYREGLASLTAAYETLVEAVPAALGTSAAPPSATERLAAERDRRAVAALYPPLAATEADQAEAGAFAPLLAWLDRERGVSISVDRQRRLTLLGQHLKAHSGRLLARAPATKADLLTGMRLTVKDDLTLAGQQIADMQQRAKGMDAQIRKLTADLKQDGEALAHLEKVKADGAEADRIRAVLGSVRGEVLSQADAARLNDAGGVLALLRVRLLALKSNPPQGALKAEDYALVLARLASYEAPGSSACSQAGSCDGKTQMDIIDAQIASLRAQRVQALARGDKASADNLLAAINAAYEQRTSMIYLRPASDYLRSVHSASDLQDAAEKQFRNMLDDWRHYMKPGILSDGDPDFRRRIELEKLYWQNINRVTLGGGGKGNFVVAKDDVGNWYVKAFSADPKAIFDSATKLALFNTGGRINVNLLQKYETQARIDASTDGAEKAALRKELENGSSQDGKPLLALRDRYARQYRDATRLSALRLKDQLGSAGPAIDALIANASGMGSCKVADLKSGVAALDKPYLESPRTQLEALLAAPAPVDPLALPEGLEKAVQSGITGLHLYGAKVYQALDESKAEECPPELRRQLARDSRKLVQARVLDIASERRSDIERYEGALVNIAEVAVQR